MKKWKLAAYRVALELMPCREQPAACTGGAPQRLAKILHFHHAHGAAVALFDRHGLTGLCTYGEAAPGQPVTADTAFRVASVSKHITAMAAWRLHEAGEIDLDADADTFLPCSLRHPQAPDTPITLRRLLSHTAGIHDGADYAAACRDNRPLSLLMQGDSHTAAFGGFEYSNLGAGIAACVLEGMLGRSFEAIMQDTLFAPLHVTASFYPQKMAGPLANSYRVLPPQKAPALDAQARRAQPLPADTPDPARHYLLAQGNLYITAPELAKLGAELLRERYAPMRRKIVPFGARDPLLCEGLGTFIVDPAVCGRVVYGHQGLAYGAMHGLFYDPESGRGAALLTSGCSEARVHVLSDINKAIIKQVFHGTDH